MRCVHLSWLQVKIRLPLRVGLNCMEHVLQCYAPHKEDTDSITQQQPQYKFCTLSRSQVSRQHLTLCLSYAVLPESTV